MANPVGPERTRRPPGRSVGPGGAHAVSVGEIEAGHQGPGVIRPPGSNGAPVAQRPLAFAEALRESGLLSPEQVARAQETALREGLSLGRVLVRDGYLLSRELAGVLALHKGLTMVDLRSRTIDPQATAALPEAMARRYLAIPIGMENGTLTVAVAYPDDLQLLEDLAVRTGAAIEPVVATAEDILAQADASYRMTEGLSAWPGEGAAPTGDRVTAGVLLQAQPTQVIELVLRQALMDRASDIHIEPSEARLRVRFRIDGILHDVLSLPAEMHATLISRLKIMSGMNIAERRRPQDGHFTFKVDRRNVDVRAAVSGTVEGEMTVLRLLDKEFTLIGLDQLGMSERALEQYRSLLRLPYGMVLVCGPTGSGKSTTLYASILQMDRAEKNVISLEDPVEYRISDANQMQVHAEAGVTFASQLRSVLRLDPDVILVGEVRDQETALIATQAAMTGHLVLTSIHANDTVSALLRLRDLGVAPYLIASSLAGVVAQRMVRVVCGNCRAMARRPPPEQKAYAAETGEVVAQFAYGSGCNVCAHTGYKGRTGVFEVLTMTDALRQLFLADAPRHALWEQALKEGMVPLRREGMLKVGTGATTPYEVMRVLYSLDQ